MDQWIESTGWFLDKTVNEVDDMFRGHQFDLKIRSDRVEFCEENAYFGEEVGRWMRSTARRLSSVAPVSSRRSPVRCAQVP